MPVRLEPAISNLVCGWYGRITYHIWVALTSNLVSRIIVSGANPTFFEVTSQMWSVDASWDG